MAVGPLLTFDKILHSFDRGRLFASDRAQVKMNAKVIYVCR